MKRPSPNAQEVMSGVAQMRLVLSIGAGCLVLLAGFIWSLKSEIGDNAKQLNRDLAENAKQVAVLAEQIKQSNERIESLSKSFEKTADTIAPYINRLEQGTGRLSEIALTIDRLRHAVDRLSFAVDGLHRDVGQLNREITERQDKSLLQRFQTEPVEILLLEGKLALVLEGEWPLGEANIAATEIVKKIKNSFADYKSRTFFVKIAAASTYLRDTSILSPIADTLRGDGIRVASLRVDTDKNLENRRFVVHVYVEEKKG